MTSPNQSIAVETTTLTTTTEQTHTHTKSPPKNSFDGKENQIWLIPTKVVLNTRKGSLIVRLGQLSRTTARQCEDAGIVNLSEVRVMCHLKSLAVVPVPPDWVKPSIDHSQ